MKQLLLFGLFIFIIYLISIRNGFKWNTKKTKECLWITILTWGLAIIAFLLLISIYLLIKEHLNLYNLGFYLLIEIIPATLLLFAFSIPMITIHFIFTSLFYNSAKKNKNILASIMSGVLGVVTLIIIVLNSSEISINEIIEKNITYKIIGISFTILFISSLTVLSRRKINVT